MRLFVQSFSPKNWWTLHSTAYIKTNISGFCKTSCFLVHLTAWPILQAGHPFQQRCAHSAYSHARLQQESPIFLLLLDCVWQLWRQFPLALGFSETLLLRLANEVYASDYGTFLCNNDQERSVQHRRRVFQSVQIAMQRSSVLIIETNNHFQVCPRSEGQDSLFVPGPAEAAWERLLLKPSVWTQRAGNLALSSPTVPAALERWAAVPLIIPL